MHWEYECVFKPPSCQTHAVMCPKGNSALLAKKEKRKKSEHQLERCETGHLYKLLWSVIKSISEPLSFYFVHRVNIKTSKGTRFFPHVQRHIFIGGH